MSRSDKYSRRAFGLPLLSFFALGAGCASEPEPHGPIDPAPAASWAAWPMPNSEGLGLPNEQSYEFVEGSADAIVHDRVTGLDWQRTLDPASFTWSAASLHCAALSYGGFSDWRVPTRIELVSLLDLSRTDPAITLAAFPDTASEWYWTASEDASDEARAWDVYFYFGYPDVAERVTENRVRCVRRAQPLAPALPHYEATPELVRDSGTGLAWQRVAAAESFDAAAAREYCAGLVLGAESGFRVPTMKELQTLVDDRHFEPAIDVEAFPDAPSESFWSSSAWSGTTELAWYVRFDSGGALYDVARESMRVRCVR